MKYGSLIRLLILLGFTLIVSACSTMATEPRSKPRPQARVIQPLPPVPEIKAPVTPTKPYQYEKPKAVQRPKVVKKKYKPAKVQPYPGSTEETPVKPTEKVQEEQAEAEKSEEVGEEIDPYADIPDSADGTSSTDTVSPAVKSLMDRARADAALGRNAAAMVKLERGLRIEPQNPKLWYHLAELNYNSGNYDQAITMAKKAINFSSNDADMVDKNWDFISKVASKSGNREAIAEANDYKSTR